MPRYLILTVRKPTFNESVLPDHFTFLDGLRGRGKVELSGGFTDKTGGAYVLLAENQEEAEAIAFADPIHVTNSSSVSVHEWNAR
ncbi:MAG TPA: YciI family protein [Chthoniobacterales bacterium]